MNEDQLQWDKDNGVEYAAYTMQPMGASIKTLVQLKQIYSTNVLAGRTPAPSSAMSELPQASSYIKYLCAGLVQS